MTDKTKNRATTRFVRAKVQQFVGREFPGFTAFLRQHWETNPQALLSTTPPNHSYDVEDGTYDLALGEAVKKRKEYHASMSGTIWAFHIDAEGRYRKVLAGLSKMKADDQMEAAMAFLLEYRKGSYLCNEAIWRQVAEKVGKAEGLDNPFYVGVCKKILKLFKSEGWLK